LQNHSEAVHETKYRRNKVKQAMGQSLALMTDLNKIAEEEEANAEVTYSNRYINTLTYWGLYYKMY
jgi:hypothetical protein